jgi:6-pyruvoyl-tetrahydropterin synthase related domain
MSSFPAPFPASLESAPPSSGISQVRTATWMFGIMAAVFLAWPVWRLGFFLEVNRNEPWAAWFADAVSNGTPLYPSAKELIVNNYPPLSYYLTAAISRLTGDTIVAGRLIALASAFAFSASAGLCILALGGSRAVALFGGFWLLAMLARFFANYVGVNDPSMLAITLMSLGLAYFLHRHREGRAVEPAIALMVLVGFVKHNMPALPLAALVWLAMTDKRAAMRAALFGAALSGAGLLLCAAAFGPDFAMQMLMPREIGLKHVLFSLNRLQWFVPAWVFIGLWAWPNRKEPAARFTALLLGFSLLNGLIQAAGAGVTYNAYLGLLLATAIGAALAFEGIGSTAIAKRYRPGAIRTAMVAVLVLRLLLSQQLEFLLVLTSPSFREQVRQHAAAMSAEIDRVRSIPGAVSCWPITVCYRAGKAFVYDQYWVPQLIATGRWSKEAVEQAIQERGIRFEEIAPSVSVGKKRLF